MTSVTPVTDNNTNNTTGDIDNSHSNNNSNNVPDNSNDNHNGRWYRILNFPPSFNRRISSITSFNVTWGDNSNTNTNNASPLTITNTNTNANANTVANGDTNLKRVQVLSIGNALSYIGMIVVTLYVAPLDEKISREHLITCITPLPFAYSIWGLIYLLQGLVVAFQLLGKANISCLRLGVTWQFGWLMLVVWQNAYLSAFNATKSQVKGQNHIFLFWLSICYLAHLLAWLSFFIGFARIIMPVKRAQYLYLAGYNLIQRDGTYMLNASIADSRGDINMDNQNEDYGYDSIAQRQRREEGERALSFDNDSSIIDDYSISNVLYMNSIARLPYFRHAIYSQLRQQHGHLRFISGDPPPIYNGNVAADEKQPLLTVWNTNADTTTDRVTTDDTNNNNYDDNTNPPTYNNDDDNSNPPTYMDTAGNCLHMHIGVSTNETDNETDNNTNLDANDSDISINLSDQQQEEHLFFKESVVMSTLVYGTSAIMAGWLSMEVVNSVVLLYGGWNGVYDGSYSKTPSSDMYNDETLVKFAIVLMAPMCFYGVYTLILFESIAYIVTLQWALFSLMKSGVQDVMHIHNHNDINTFTNLSTDISNCKDKFSDSIDYFSRFVIASFGNDSNVADNSNNIDTNTIATMTTTLIHGTVDKKLQQYAYYCNMILCMYTVVMMIVITKRRLRLATLRYRRVQYGQL